jgi:hypothetical protein
VTVPEEFGFRIITECKHRLIIYQSHCNFFYRERAKNTRSRSKINIFFFTSFSSPTRGSRLGLPRIRLARPVTGPYTPRHAPRWLRSY